MIDTCNNSFVILISSHKIVSAATTRCILLIALGIFTSCQTVQEVSSIVLMPSFMRQAQKVREIARNTNISQCDSENVFSFHGRAVDSLYTAVSSYSTSEQEAAFLMVLATMTHSKIPLIFGFSVPLTLESDEDFQTRRKHLPSRLFIDTLTKEVQMYGDADKLQHFFASAWLTSLVGSAWIADILGVSVETGENLFVRGEHYDERDIRANRLGQRFASDHWKCMPSTYFQLWNESWKKQTLRQGNDNDSRTKSHVSDSTSTK